MAETSDLLGRVPAFEGLPEDQIAWFLSQSKELHLKAGDVYARQGDPADAMFVILEGQLQGRGEVGGETIMSTMSESGRHPNVVHRDEVPPMPMNKGKHRM